MNLHEPLVSVLIPLYNCEDYLAECLDSISSQTYKNLEIILINDGSTDSSGEIARRYAQKDKRIKFFSQENKGIAETRNRTLDSATGDYIMFLDSDDYVSHDIVEKLYAGISENDCDVSVSDYENVFESGYNPTFMATVRTALTGVEPVEKVLYDYCNNMIINISALWAKMYKRELFDNLRFRKDVVIAEDMFIMTDLYLRCKKIYLCQDKMYFYRLRSSSITHLKIPTDRHYRDFFDATKYKITQPIAHGFTNLPCFMDARLLESVTESWKYKLDNFTEPDIRQEQLKELNARREWFEKQRFEIKDGKTFLRGSQKQ
ncbi:MAG: glycosyltransferase [Spirochaetaceae bacterium]|jgi:glycosyltransferase involved in cell wall biosynthesis|nr:glycosyltransferase [Spirochaetaceae bacterium]